MIICEEVMRVHKNGLGGRWKKAVINVPTEALTQIGKYEQPVIVFIMRLDEEITIQALAEAVKNFQKITELKKELAKVKGEVVNELGKDNIRLVE